MRRKTDTRCGRSCMSTDGTAECETNSHLESAPPRAQGLTMLRAQTTCVVGVASASPAGAAYSRPLRKTLLLVALSLNNAVTGTPSNTSTSNPSPRPMQRIRTQGQAYVQLARLTVRQSDRPSNRLTPGPPERPNAPPPAQPPCRTTGRSPDRPTRPLDRPSSNPNAAPPPTTRSCRVQCPKWDTCMLDPPHAVPVHHVPEARPEICSLWTMILTCAATRHAPCTDNKTSTHQSLRSRPGDALGPGFAGYGYE